MVLVVDDYQPMCQALQKLLSMRSIPARCAYSAADAWKELLASAPDVVLLDDAMPGKNALELLQDMKATPALAHIPVVMYSAGDDPKRIAQAIRQGAVDWFVKAITPWERLLARLQELHVRPA